MIKSNIRNKIIPAFGFAVLFLIGTGIFTPLFAEKIAVPLGKSINVKIPGGKIKKIMAVKDNVVSVISATPDNEIVLAGLGNASDTTQIIIWDADGKRQTIDVETYNEGELIHTKFQSLFPEAGVDIQIFPDSIYLRGTVDRPEKIQQAEAILLQLSPGIPIRNLIEFKDQTTVGLISDALKIPTVKVTVVNQTLPGLAATGTTGIRIILEGTVKDQNEFMRMTEVVKGFVPEAQVSNLVKIVDPLQVVFQAYILQTNKGNGRDLGVDWGGTTSQGGDPSLGILRFYENVSNAFRGGTANTAGAPVDTWPNPFKFNNVNRFDLVTARVQAWQRSNLVKVLSNPKLMVYANSQLGGNNKLSGAGWTDEKSGGVGAPGEGLAYVRLSRRVPYLGQPDNRGIRAPEYTDADLSLSIRDLFIVDDKLKFSVFAQQDDPIDRGADLPPEISRRYINTTVRIGDEETVVLGGLISHTVSRSQQGVPGLSAIPVLGRLFKHNSKAMNENELIILLTPKIISKDTTMAGYKKFETVPVPRRSERLEELHNLFQEIKQSHFPEPKKD